MSGLVEPTGAAIERALNEGARSWIAPYSRSVVVDLTGGRDHAATAICRQIRRAVDAAVLLGHERVRIDASEVWQVSKRGRWSRFGTFLLDYPEPGKRLTTREALAYTNEHGSRATIAHPRVRLTEWSRIRVTWW